MHLLLCLVVLGQCLRRLRLGMIGLAGHGILLTLFTYGEAGIC